MPLRDRDSQALEILENQLDLIPSPKNFSELIDFPFENIASLKKANKENKITLGLSNHDFNSILTYGKPSDHLNHYISMGLSLIVLFGIIGYAFYTSENIYFLGIICWIVGFALSTPNCSFQSMIGIIMLIFIASFFFMEMKYSILLGTIVLSYFFTKTNRDISINSIINNALESERLFAFLYKTRNLIVIKDNKSGSFYNPDNH